MGEGRKWSVTEIASLEEPTPTDDTAEDESEDVAQTLIVGPERLLTVPTDFDEGTEVEIVRQDDGSIRLRPIENEEQSADARPVSYQRTLQEPSPDNLDRLRLASGPIRSGILNELRRYKDAT